MADLFTGMGDCRPFIPGGEIYVDPGTISGTISMVVFMESSWALIDSENNFLIQMPDLIEGNYILVSGFANAGNNGTFRTIYVGAGEIDIPADAGFVEEGPISATITDLGVL